jgi:hypothetical protein
MSDQTEDALRRMLVRRAAEVDPTRLPDPAAYRRAAGHARRPPPGRRAGATQWLDSRSPAGRWAGALALAAAVVLIVVLPLLLVGGRTEPARPASPSSTSSTPATPSPGPAPTTPAPTITPFPVPAPTTPAPVAPTPGTEGPPSSVPGPPPTG